MDDDAGPDLRGQQAREDRDQPLVGKADRALDDADAGAGAHRRKLGGVAGAGTCARRWPPPAR
jgi:hypothetical protein